MPEPLLSGAQAPPPLLVPIAASALLVNNAVLQQTEWRRFTNVYASINSFEDPVPGLGESTGKPEIGVHLHWKLPAAIARGEQSKDGGTIDYKHLAPNRWLVARLGPPPAAPVWWVIQSDYLGSDHGTTPYADPHRSTAGNVVVTMLGRNVPLGQWSEPGDPPFLKATGIADVTFTAWQPGLMNVFAFHDPMTGVADGTPLSYLVVGWYSDPAIDPLASHAPADLEWTVLGGCKDVPTRSIFHSVVMGLDWQTTTAPDRADSTADAINVAVGYTSTDALAAMVGALDANGSPPPDELVTHLEAFQRGLLQTLEKPGGPAALEQDVRASWFRGRSGGTAWDIVPVAQGQTSTDPLEPVMQPPAPPLTHDQAVWLANLNVAQRRYDSTTRALETAQWELYALWWKSRVTALNEKSRGESGDNPDTNPAIPIKTVESAVENALKAALANVQELQADCTSDRGNVPDPTSSSSIAAWSGRIPANGGGLTLRPRAMQPFMHPVDPVVLVGGITPPPTDPAPKTGLPCRLATATVTGVHPAAGPVTSTTGSLAGDVPALPASSLDAVVAGAAQALATEAFFADAANARLILADGLGITDSNDVTALSKAMTAGTAQTATIAHPLQASWAFQAWHQAWAPLFLQWQIKWRATLPVGKQVGTGLDGIRGIKDNWPFDCSQWRFDAGDGVADRGGEYYAWTGTDNWSDDKQLPPDPGTAIDPSVYTGRTFLTAHATVQLVARLEEYVAVHPDADLEAIKGLIDKVGDTLFLSQTLSGFNDTLVMRSLQHTPPPDPDSDIGKAVAGEHRGAPVPSAGSSDQRFGAGTPFFFPLRGGFFSFERLEIVDAFGQALDLLQANGNKDGTAASFVPIKAQGLAPDAGSTLPGADQRLKQAPRVVQPSRLNIRMLDRESDASEVGIVADTDPVCGWLLPNHLDGSIAAYDPAGVALGELLVATDPASGDEQVRWLPAPGGGAPDDPSKIASTHLSAALGAFTAPNGGIPPADRPAALRALYASIDETLWTIEPGGGQGDQDLAALIGPPLALVRAELQLELFGQPAYNQSWRDTGLEQTAGIESIPLEIRVGSTELLDDGVVGYWTGAEYTRFSASHLAGPASPHVQAIAPGNYLSLPFDYPSYTKVALTLLVDPRGSVHATTGVLPITKLVIPAQFYEPALKAIAATFRVGPVLSDPALPRMPIPGDRRGRWSWVVRTTPGNDAGDFTTSSIVPADGTPRLADAPPHLVDGWLRFVPDDLEGGA